MSGKLVMNALVMYDHQTDTLWSQFLSRGVEGPLAGVQLEIVPAIQTTWEQWAQLYPDTLVLENKGRTQGNAYAGYFADDSAGIMGETHSDPRLPRKELVLGLVLGESAIAYPFSTIARQRVVNDSFAGEEVAAVFDLKYQTGVIFDRRAAGRTLTFNPLPDTRQGMMLMQDRETGTTWQAVTGRAVDGELAGQVLRRLPSHYSFWFAWTDYHPETQLYRDK